MDIEQELKILRKSSLEKLKDEIKYSVKIFNNAKRNNIEYFKKEHFLKVMQEHKKQYKILTEN